MIYLRERYAYLFLLVLCVGIFYVIFTQLQEGGPRIAPYTATGIIFLSSLGCFIRCLRGKEKIIEFPKKVLFMLLTLILFYGIYIYFIEIIGYFLLSIIFIAVSLWLLKVQSVLKILLVSILVPVGVYLILGELLNLRFPTGVFM